MAFVTMMNKLIFAHKEVLQPLLTSLRSISQKDAISRLSELDERLEKNAERQNTLTTLMTRGYIDPALFTQESNDLLTEAQALTEEKEHLVFSVNGEMKKTENCLHCGACMKKCPYSLNIPELLIKNYEDYKKIKL